MKPPKGIHAATPGRNCAPRHGVALRHEEFLRVTIVHTGGVCSEWSRRNCRQTKEETSTRGAGTASWNVAYGDDVDVSTGYEEGGLKGVGNRDTRGSG